MAGGVFFGLACWACWLASVVMVWSVSVERRERREETPRPRVHIAQAAPRPPRRARMVVAERKGGKTEVGHWGSGAVG